VNAVTVGDAASGVEDLVVRHRVGRPALDLGRDVFALLGLVFDATDVEAAAARLRRLAEDGERCFLSTPNVNFAMAALTDKAFRDSVLQCDFSVADGAPLVALARWLEIPLPGRVAGADLFEHLRRHGDPQRPLKVFFFGGDDGVAARAAAVIEAERGSMRCVGFESPGFGSIESMSSDDRLARINASGADFIVVSLGAIKGQAWIQHNRARLVAPLISHLGAVVNFVAGNVRRAPLWLRGLGIEWLWRIGAEPALWRRYAKDGASLLWWLASVVPERWRLRVAASGAPAQFDADTSDARCVRLHLRGTWSRTDLPPLRAAVATVLNGGRDVRFNVSGLDDADASVLALFALVDAWQGGLRAIEPGARLAPRLRDRVVLHGMQHLFEDA
jgi:N-acetylglucosaminyldiphosphoundecaprenol N-acetyl-beta-D-mannosaminyltransferase